MKPKLALQGCWRKIEGPGLAGRNSGADALSSTESGVPVFADVVLSDKGRRTITAAELSRLRWRIKNEDSLLQPCVASLDMERVTRIFSARMKEVVDTDGIVKDMCCT